MSKLGKVLNVLSAVCLFIAFVVISIQGWLNPSLGDETGILLFILEYCCLLIPMALLSSAWLTWFHRKKLSNIFIWIVFQLIFGISFALYPLGLFFSSILILSFILLGFIDFLYAYQNRASVKFIGWGSIGFMWSILIAWRIKGDLMAKFIESIVTDPQNFSNDIWWRSEERRVG